MLGAAQAGAHRFDRVRDNRVDIARQPLRQLGRFKHQRQIELVVLQLQAQIRVPGA